MSYFCENKKLDLSGKMIEELNSIQKELIIKKKKITSEKVKLNKSINLYDIQLNDIDKDIQIILKEIKRIEDDEEVKKMLNKDFNKVKGFNLLTASEFLIITKNMDRTDYRKLGAPTRFCHFEEICREVIKIKTHYPTWILTDLIKVVQNDMIPHHIFYRYEYKDENGYTFDIGGLKFIY